MLGSRRADGPSRISPVRDAACCRWRRQQRDRLACDPFLPVKRGRGGRRAWVANSCFKPISPKRPAGKAGDGMALEYS
jgi:hypothetical protein